METVACPATQDKARRSPLVSHSRQITGGEEYGPACADLRGLLPRFTKLNGPFVSGKGQPGALTAASANEALRAPEA